MAEYMEFKEFFEEISALPTDIIRESPYTMPYIFDKAYNENFISDWLAFVLNPQINGIGAEPIKALLRLAGYDGIPADELFFNNEDFSSREKMSNSVKKIKNAFEWLNRTYTSQIDAIMGGIQSRYNMQ